MTDVCLVLEGTYPYITGGVSSCVSQIINSTPQISYSIVYIGANKKDNQKFKYKIPQNVKLLKEIYLFDQFKTGNDTPRLLGLNPRQIATLENSILFGRQGDLDELYTTFFDPNSRVCDPNDLFFSKEVWNIIEKEYYLSFDKETAPSFIDFFYTWRFSNFPIFKILSSDIPRATVYHTKCTGYAGLLAVVAKKKYQVPMILTEHGIYTHERKIEISQSQWLYSTDDDFIAKSKMSYFKEWWMNKFIKLGELAYDHADVITTLYKGNLKNKFNWVLTLKRFKSYRMVLIIRILQLP
jgi:hypothetical protein